MRFNSGFKGLTVQFWVLHGPKLATVGLPVVSLTILTLQTWERKNWHEWQHFSLTLLLAFSFLVYLQLPQSNSEKTLEVKPHLLTAKLSSIDYVVSPYITLMTASINRLSLPLHSLDYFIFPILPFYNFLHKNTCPTLKMCSVVRDSNLCDCYICPSKSLSSSLYVWSR